MNFRGRANPRLKSPVPVEASLREVLTKHVSETRNYAGKPFMAAAAVRSLVTPAQVVNWIKNHHLRQPPESSFRDDALVPIILSTARLLFAILVMAEIEYHTYSFLSHGLGDDHLSQLEPAPSFLLLTEDEQPRFSKKNSLIPPILRRKKHLLVSLSLIKKSNHRLLFSC
jgi:hypothetical protein